MQIYVISFSFFLKGPCTVVEHIEAKCILCSLANTNDQKKIGKDVVLEVEKAGWLIVMQILRCCQILHTRLSEGI